MGSPTRLALLITVALFVIFMIVKSRMPIIRDPALREARKRIADARARARKAKEDGPARARAYREAATLALDDLGRPALAASYARRADKADPDAEQGLALVSRAMRAGERFRALEKLLWQRLAEVELDSDRAGRLFDELLALYEGPLRGRSQAKVLRALLDERTKA